MTRYLILALAHLLATIASHGQDMLPIATDRPDQTECPFIVPKGYFQAENGLIYEKKDANSHVLTHPTVLWKYGFSDNFELRLITERVSESIVNDTKTGFTPVTVGFKVKVMEEKGILPKTSFIGHLAIPMLASEAFRADFYAPSFRFTMQHTLSDKLTLAYNLGAEWDGSTPEPTAIYTLTTGLGITKKLGAYVELYGFAPQNQAADHRFDGGLTCLINNNVMIDVSGGLGLSQNAPNYFVGLGLSYRFKVR